MKGRRRGWLLFVACVSLGCAGKDRSDRSSFGTTQDSAVVAKPIGPGAQDSLREEAMEDRLGRMATASDMELGAEMPAYRASTRAIIEEFRAEMMRKNLDGGEWRRMLAAISDDLKRTETMTPTQVRAFWPEHSHRVHEILALHAWMNGRLQSR